MRLLRSLFVILVVILLFSSKSYAQPVRILMVETMAVPVVLEHEKYFIEGLEQLGYQIGKDVILDELKAEGSLDIARAKLKNYLSNTRPDLVVSFATLASQAVKEALTGTGIPQVFCVVSDPVGAGLIKAVGRPTDSNITGLVFSLLRQSKMDLAGELLAQPFQDRQVRVGVILSSYPAAVTDLQQLEAIAAQTKSIKFHSFQLDYHAMPQGLDEMLTDVRKGVEVLSPQIDYWWIVPGPLGETTEFPRILLNSDIPVGLCHTRECTEMGGLFFVNPSYKEGGHQTASIVDAILKGTPAGTIPPVPPDSFEMGLNVGTAIRLGIVIPSDFMELAGKNIWR